MSHLSNAISTLLDAHGSFLDAFETAVLERLPPTDRRALEGSVDSHEESYDRLPLLEIVVTHALRTTDAILKGEAQDVGLLAVTAANAAAIAADAVSQRVQETSLYLARRDGDPLCGDRNADE